MKLKPDFEFDAISDQCTVSESNALLEARTNLTLYEERLIYILASRIAPNDTAFKTHFFKVKDLAEKLSLTEKNFYKRVRDLIDGLQDKRVVIEDRSTGCTLSAHWLASARYYDGKGLIELEFSQALRPYLLELSHDATKFSLSNVLYLTSFYSSKLYKLLKPWVSQQRRLFTIRELREKLELAEGTYEKYNHLKTRILLAAQAELAAKTDIFFSFEELKNGMKVTGVVFYVHPNRTPTHSEPVPATAAAYRVKEEPPVAEPSFRIK